MTDRILDPIRAIILDEMPELTFLGLWEYAVTSVNADGSVNGQPTDARIPLPDLNSVPVSSLGCGGTGKPRAGATFLVEFRNRSGALYAVVGATPFVVNSTIDGTGTVAIGPTAANPVKLGPGQTAAARSGDSATVFWPVGLLNGTLTTGSGPVPVVDLPIQFLTPAPCLIVSGNESVLE